jgi:hypothetical protein
LDSDEGFVMCEEGFAAPQAQGIGQSGGIAEFGMAIQGEVLGVNGEVTLYQGSDQGGAATGPGNHRSPEETVMNEQQIASSPQGHVDHDRGSIDGSGDAAHPAIILELESIDGTVVVLEPIGLEPALKMIHQIGEGDGVGLGHRKGVVVMGKGLGWGQVSMGYFLKPSA